MSEVDLMGLLEVASDVLSGITVAESEVFSESGTREDWAVYDAVS